MYFAKGLTAPFPPSSGFPEPTKRARDAHAGLTIRPQAKRVALRGLGYVVDSAVNGMAETTPVLDTQSFVNGRIAQIKLTNWGWTTPAQFQPAIYELVSNRCSLYRDSCDEIGTTPAQWQSYVARLTADYTNWYNGAIAEFKAAHNGMDPDQAAAAGQAATDLYNAQLMAAAQSGATERQAESQAQLAVDSFLYANPVRANSAPVASAPVQTASQQAPVQQVSTAVQQRSSAAPAPVAAAVMPQVGSGLSEMLSGSIEIMGYSIPTWAAVAGVVGGLWFFSGNGRR